MEAKTREPFLDFVKALAIILVVIGHCMQYGSGTEYFVKELYYNNFLFKIIYSFHMPLFALISGYLLYYTISRRDSVSALKREVSSVLIPVLAWSASFYLVFRGKEIIDSGWLLYIKGLIKFCLTDIWFLWAVFWCAVAIIVVNKLFKDNIIVHCIVITILLLIPEKMNSHYYIFLYPYFVIGYIWNKHKLTRRVAELDSRIGRFLIWGLLALWIVLIMRFDYNSYIYTSHISLYGSQLTKQLAIDMYRWIIGFAGSAVVIAFGRIIFNEIVAKASNNRRCYSVILEGLSYLGKHTLGVYCTSFYLNGLLYLLCRNISYNPLTIILESVVVLTISIFFDWLIGRNKVLRQVYLGGR